MPDSDSLYHRLFSHPRMVEELVREFVPRELADGLDFSGLRRVNGKFHFRRRSARRRESDVIWRVPARENRKLHWYFLIEFQSENDAWMAVRTQVYEGLLWQQVIDEQRLQARARLPALLLVVLYNGEPPWKAATTTGELVALSPDSTPWCWQPQVRYCLLDMGRFPREELARRSSLVALLFRLEQRHSPEELKTLMAQVIGWFRRHAGCNALKGLFTELIRKALVKRGLKLSRSCNLSEVKSMLTIDYETSKRQWFAEGEIKGEAKGKTEALISLLVGRFGAVAPSYRKRIRQARLVTLERWFKRAISAPDLPSVFKSPR